MKELRDLFRPNILSMASRCYAREITGRKDTILLDGNENPYNTPYNRLPDPLLKKLHESVAKVKGVASECTFLGHGSDEVIDIIYRCFCRPGVDNVVALCPTYEMYQQFAEVNDVQYRKVMLDNSFQVSAEALLGATDENTKVIWICSPNNPTGNNINRDEIVKTLEWFQGIVVVDEAYSEFSTQRPFRTDLKRYPNLIILNTLSTAWGCAALPVGMAFASKEIASVFNKVKLPYNMSQLAQEKAVEVLSDPYQTQEWVKTIRVERDRLMSAFRMLPITEEVYPSSANFFLARVKDARKVYHYLFEEGIIVRDCSHLELCGNCLRITVGTRAENAELIGALRRI